MANDNSTDDVINSEERQDTGAGRAAQKGKDKAKEQAKKALKKAKEAQKKGKYAKGIGKILWPVIAIVIIIIMIIGFIAFAINMPGAVVDKIMTTMSSAILSVSQWWTEDDIRGISPEQLYDKKLELLNYLKDMGYDVVGMGFVQSISETPTEEDPSKTKITWFEENITLNDSSNTTVQPSYLFSYYVANERIYTTTHLNFLSSVLKTTGATNTWGEGMLNMYGDESIVDSKKIDRENLTLTFKNTHGFFKTDTYQYNIDGWAGRYGTPLELLLTIHSSTMMPDLVYEFVSNKNLQTLVNIDAQEVNLKVNLKLVGPDGERDINVGSVEDEAIPIEFVRDDKTNEYKVNNIQQIKDGLANETYTLASLYKGFESFENTFNDAETLIGADATQKKIQEIINMSSPYFYETFQPDVNMNSYGTSVLFGRYYLGTSSEIENGASLYNGLVTIDSVDKSNKKVKYTENVDGNSSTIEDTLCRSVALTNMSNALKNDDKIIDWTDEERFSAQWRSQVQSNYRFIFEEVDKYIKNLVDGGTVSYDNIRYDSNNTYLTRFENWVDGLQPPMEFDEYVESKGLQSANQYEKEGKYKNYIANWADEQVVPLNSILADINYDLGVERDTKAIAEQLKEELANQLGLTVEQVNLIYEEFLVKNPEIKTFVPQIKSVVKHWYKDLVFQYKNTAKGTIFESPYPGECAPGYNLYYQFETLDENYPVQDGEPYVIKGDVVTQNGKEVNNSEISVDGETAEILEDYTLGTGYKVARKLFTQGYYYQYDGTKETAEEIANAKRIEYYPKGTTLKVTVKNNKLKLVVASTEHPAGYETHRYADEHNVDVEKEKAVNTYDIYYISAPGPYISPAYGHPDLTTESINDINNLLEKLGTDLRRKKVTMSNNTTSLNALAMLEGMHSLDSDYIYREFKEFLIELGYYSRAEIESVETNVLDWFLPGYTPDQWPPVKSDEEITEYGTTLVSSSNVKEQQVLKVDKVASLDNFIFYTDTNGIYDTATLQGQGTNVKFSNTVDADSIVNEIVSSNPAAICLYVNANSKDDENAIVKTKKLLEDIRAKLREKEYKSANLPIYVLQILPLDEPDILAEASKEIVDQNKKINDYNTSLYSVCLNQDNVKFIDATSGCVSDSGWLSDSSAAKISANIVNCIVKKNVSNGGFEEDVTVITPGAGYVTAVSENEITIEFSVEKDHSLKSIDGFSMIIKGIKVDEELRNNFASGAITDEEGNVKYGIEKGATIGVTTTENIKLILRDRNKAILGNIEDYMNLPNENDIEIGDDYDVSDTGNYITDVKKFEAIFERYENIKNNAQAFIDMQEKYQVNAVFAACATIAESSGGTNWDLISPDTYNWFSIKGSYNGSSSGVWRKYPNFAAAVDDFGDLIAVSGPYYAENRYKVSEIGPIYNPGGTWGEDVAKLMTAMYERGDNL